VSSIRCLILTQTTIILSIHLQVLELKIILINNPKISRQIIRIRTCKTVEVLTHLVWMMTSRTMPSYSVTRHSPWTCKQEYPKTCFLEMAYVLQIVWMKRWINLSKFRCLTLANLMFHKWIETICFFRIISLNSILMESSQH